MKRIKVFIDYPIAENKKFMGLSFPQVLHTYLKGCAEIELVGEDDDIDVLFVISGGSHYAHLNHEKMSLFDRLVSSLKGKSGPRTPLMGRNLYYEKRLKTLIRKNPRMKIIHRLDSRYRSLCKLYGFDETVEFINQFATTSVYQTDFGRREYEEGVESIFGFEKPVQVKNPVLINNGVDREVFRPDGDKYDWKGKFKIIHVATTGMTRKGLGTLLQIADLLKENDDFQFYLVGRQDKDPIYGRKIPKYKNVVKIPHTSDRYELAKLYRSADILLYPTINDCSPNVVTEAMSCGLAILAANSGGTPELVIKEELQAGLLIQDKNPLYSLREVVLNLQKFKDNAVEVVERYHSEEKMGTQYLNLIKSVFTDKQS